ncbi:hypothetical protein [Cysteiniphilum litorale]|uniref:Uncharacterized protein n=2 Tax=Cysteiniphilum TaxID=2056696 RepID=A0A8J2Z7G3_9GAMM|nr:hypothetical protein [Cysteiniphilum litorale]GGG08666.1 hypothetical protein GCM10010995_27770 [Cysteiniphilum litorale]
MLSTFQKFCLPSWVKKTNPDHLKQTVTCEEVESFKKAKAYSEWKKYQIKRASTIFAGLVIAMLLLGFNYGNIVTPENGLGLVIPFIIITLLLFSLFYIYILAIWLITSISEIKSGDAKSRKIQEEIYSCL